MKSCGLFRFFIVIPLCVAMVSCGSARKVSDESMYLRRNDVVIVGEGLKTSDIFPYIKQQLPGFSLFASKSTVYNEKLVPASVENIKSHLRYLGYYDSEVLADVYTKDSRVFVTYVVHPGDKMRISSFSYELPDNEAFELDYLKDTSNISIKVGDYLSEESLEKESERSAAYLRSCGYFGFSKNFFFFEADTLSGRDSISLRMQIKEHSRAELESASGRFRKYRIGDVSISHPSDLPFREEVLTDLNLIKPGEIYDERVINNTYNRLSSLRVFNTVGVELTPADSTTVRCDINLKSGRVQGFKADLETSTNSTGLIGISPQLSYYHKNIFHGGEWLNLSFLGNFQFMPNDPVRSNEFGVSAGLSFPKFLGLPNSLFSGGLVPRTEIKASYNYQDRPEYSRNIVSTSFGYSGSFNSSRFQYQLFPIQVNIVRLNDLDSDFYKTLESNPYMRYTYQNHFDAGVGAILYHTTKPAGKENISYSYSRLALDLSGNALSLLRGLMAVDDGGNGLVWGAPFTQYVRGEYSACRTWYFGKDDGHVIAAHFVAGAGYAYGNSTAIPFEKQFYCGGANSMRGWQARALGPGRSPVNKAFSIPSQTGDIKLEANLEYRFNMFWKLEGALFTDIGNVWTLMDHNELSYFTSSNFFNSLAADWGYGLRCDLNFLIVRVDMGLKMFSPDTQSWYGPSRWFKNDGFALHFGVGYPF